MIAAEEFTFPVISTNAAVNLAHLPPLWRISDDADSDHGNSAVRQRRSFARPIISIDGEGSEEDVELQEKMDLLWEDFNEELQSSADTSDSGFSEGTSQFHNNDDRNCGRDEFEALEECCNVRQLNLIRAKTKTKPKKKMESVLVKVMKKIFSLQNTACTNQQKIY